MGREKFPKPPPGWQINRKGNSLFFYYGNANDPTYVFKRKGEDAHWKGHGITRRSIGEVRDWVALQR